MTAIATQTINLDLRPHFNRQNNCIVYCSQYDNDLRNVVVNIADAGTAVNVSTYTIYIEGTKPDKKGFSYELTDIGGTVSNNVVTFPLQLQMTACAGITNAELVFYSGDDRIGSSNFILAVEKAGLADDIDVSETDIPAYVDGAQQAAQAAEDAKDTAVAVAASIPEDYTTLSNDVDDLKNAFDNELIMPSAGHTIIQGSYNSSGAIASNPARIRVSGFIEVKKGETIKFTAGTNTTGMLVGIFNENKVYQRETWYADGANVSIEADGFVILVYRKDTSNTAITPEEYDAVTQIIPMIWNTIADTTYQNNSIPLNAIEGISNVYSYRKQILKNKTIGVVSGSLRITDGADEVYLFEKGFGFVTNDTTYIMLVNKSTLARVEHKSPNVVINLATVGENQYLAVCKTGLHTLDFDFVTSNKFPYTNKDISQVPKTKFSVNSYASGIISYNGSIKAFAPFRYNGTIRTENCTGYFIYNDDGTLESGASIVNNAVTVANKIVVIVSNNNIENASIYPLSSPYQYSGKLCSVFGDSLTADAPYYPYLAELTGLQIKNCGIGGTRVSGTGTNAMHQNVRINAIEGDFIVIMGGSNDATGSATIGTLDMTNHDTDTFVGAYNVMLSKIYYRYGISAGYYSDIDYTGVTQLENVTLPNIILVTPPKVFTSQTNYNNIEAYCDYVKQIAKWWGLPVVDAFSNMQMSWISKDYYFASNDYTHYNTHGRSKLGALIAAKFAECYANINSQ